MKSETYPKEPSHVSFKPDPSPFTDLSLRLRKWPLSKFSMIFATPINMKNPIILHLFLIFAIKGAIFQSLLIKNVVGHLKISLRGR